MGNEILKAAEQYARLGLAVFPVTRAEKRPYTPNGCKDAKTDLAAIRFWWKKWPDANIGIATGSISGNLIVIDLDLDNDKGINGYEVLKEWEKENGELPETWMAITGRGGYHMYYRHPDPKSVPNSISLMDGIDVRSEGGYVVAPPSIHKNGTCYEWEYDPKEFELADANDTVMKLLSEAKKNKERQSRFSVPETIEDGTRNSVLFKLAASLQAQGLADEAILSAVQAQNQKSCVHPLEDDEVERIVNSAIGYSKGELKELKKAMQSAWREPQFSTYVTSAGEEKLCQTIENIAEAIEYDRDLWGRIRYNTLAYAPYVYSNLPWTDDNGRKFREWTNTDDSNLKSYIEGKYGFRSMDKIMEALKIVSARHKYNPVCDLLEGCFANWDGEKHIENLLPDYLGADLNEYTVAVMRLVMLGAISRAYYPGCKFDLTMILYGGQGIGKSTFTKYLALNDDWFNDNFNTLDGDKAAEKLRGMWIVEMAELLAAKRAKEVESIKSFLTSRVDVYRPPYERRSENRPRSCIFIGTTNSSHFLTDRTGNRRFLPIVTNQKAVKKSLFDDEQATRMEFAQAWGEAMSIFKASNGRPRLTLPKYLEEKAIEMQEGFLEEDFRVGIIQEFLSATEETRVCVPMILERALKTELSKCSRADSNQIHDIMQNSIRGWRRIQNGSNGRGRCGGYGIQICYEKIPQESDGRSGDEWITVEDPVFR